MISLPKDHDLIKNTSILLHGNMNKRFKLAEIFKLAETFKIKLRKNGTSEVVADKLNFLLANINTLAQHKDQLTEWGRKQLLYMQQASSYIRNDMKNGVNESALKTYQEYFKEKIDELVAPLGLLPSEYHTIPGLVELYRSITYLYNPASDGEGTSYTANPSPRRTQVIEDVTSPYIPKLPAPVSKKDEW